MATTAVMTSSAFLEIIRANKLVDEDALQARLRALSPSVLGGGDAMPIADALVEHRLLTRFQANLLLQGKSKSLRITSKYRLLDRLGVGGMGLVYLCEHIRMKRLVALKVLPNVQAKDAGNLERFYREAQAAAALKHINIVQAYDVDTDNGIHYLVMEYIDGINLEKLVDGHGAIDPLRAAHYIAQAADGLQHAAERGLVHRDIKPSNLLVDREGYVKILDMGLARFFDARTDNITERFDNNAVMGTADFIAPEQALNSHEVDIRADIYSLGCTFYYLLAGHAPYHDANTTQKLLLHQIREPIPIEEVASGIDPELAAVVRRMMAKKPEDRYQTPGDVVASLSPWTEDAISPPSQQELPENPYIGATDRTGSAATVSSVVTSSMPKRAPRPSRGMVTERITESAIRRMDGLPKNDEGGSAGKNRYLIGGAILLVAISCGAILVAVKPWEANRLPARPAAKNSDDPDRAQSIPLTKQDDPPSKVVLAPEQAKADWKKGEEFGRQREWKKALEQYQHAVDLVPMDDGHFWFEYAAVKLLAGDRDGYGTACTGMKVRFEHYLTQKAKPFRGYHLARAFTLGPNTPTERLKIVARLAEGEVNDKSAAFFALTESGAILFRTGNAKDSISFFERSLKADANPGREVVTWLWLALAHHKLGQKNEVKLYTDLADGFLKQFPERLPLEAERQFAFHYHNWLEVHILRAELAGLSAQ